MKANGHFVQWDIRITLPSHAAPPARQQPTIPRMVSRPAVPRCACVDAKPPPSGILYTWTGLGKMVHTGTYQYVLVQHSVRQYENFTVLRTCMYRYIPVRTFNKTGCFLTHPERVRRDKIKVVHLLCMGYNVTKSNFKTAQV